MPCVLTEKLRQFLGCVAIVMIAIGSPNDGYAEIVKPNIPFSDLDQDASGYLWGASSKGLFRYDGDSFLLFNTQSQLIRLPSSWLKVVHSENDYILWLGFDMGGAARLDLRNNQLNMYLPQVDVQTINTDKYGNIWIGGREKLYRLTPVKETRPETPKEASAAPEYQIDTIEVGSEVRHIEPFNDTVLVGGRGLFRVDVKTLAVESLLDDYVYDIEKGGNTWFVASNPYLYRVYADQSLERIDRLQDQTAIHLAYDEQMDYLWVSRFDNQLELHDAQSYELLPHQLDRSRGKVESMMVDQSGTLWVAKDIGLSRYSRANVMRLANTELLRQPRIVRHQDKMVLISTAQALLYDPIQNTTTRIAWIDQFLSGKYLTSVESLGSDLLLGMGTGIFVADFETQQVRPLLGDDQRPLIDDVINTIYPLSEQVWLVGSRNQGLFRLDKTNNEIISTGSGEVYAIARTDAGEIVYANNYEVVFLDDQLNELRRIQYSQDPVKITGILLEEEAIWLTGYGGGLYRVSLDSNQVEQVKSIDKTLLATGLVKDRYGTIWVSAKTGLYYVVQETNQWRLLQLTGSYTLPRQSLVLWNKDQGFASTDKGMVLWDVKKINNVSVNTELRLSKVVHGDQILPLENRQLEFPEYNEGVKLSITNNNYSPWLNQGLEYRIIGAYDQWRETPLKEISLPYLTPGHYTLEVRYPGQSESTIKEPIIINPALWKHPFALWTYFLSALLAFYLTYHKVVRLVRSKEQDVINVHQEMQVLQTDLDRSLEDKISNYVKELAQFTLAMRHMQNVPVELKNHMEHIIQLASGISSGLNRVREGLIPKSLYEANLVVALQEMADAREKQNGSEISLYGEWEKADALDTQERIVAVKISNHIMNICDQQKQPLTIDVNVIDNSCVELMFLSDAKLELCLPELKNQLRPIKGVVRKMSGGVKVVLLYDMDRLIKQIVGKDVFLGEGSSVKH